MALITCPHCGKPVSDRAVKCPHCGCELKDKSVAEKPKAVAPEPQHNTPIVEEEGSSSNSGMIILLIVILVAIGIFMYQKYYGQVEYETPTDSTAVEPFDSDTTAVDTLVKFDDTEAKLEEFKNFTSNDLAAFMLHGKVKMVKEGDSKMYFDENGTLTRYVDGWGETEIEHRSDCDELYIGSHGSGNFWITVRDGKVVKIGCDANMGVSVNNWYSNYDANNCPTRRKLVEELADEDALDGEGFHSEYFYVIKYSDYDEYGNYREKTEISDNETNRHTRTITYYPIEE